MLNRIRFSRILPYKSKRSNTLSSYSFPLFTAALLSVSLIPSAHANSASPHYINSDPVNSIYSMSSTKSSKLIDTSHVIPAKGAHKNTIVFFHGLGDSSDGFADFFVEYAPENTRIVLPNAPTRAITANGGMRMPGWYDIVSFDRSAGLLKNEDEKGIKESAARITQLLDAEIELLGNKPERLVVGGFSQGAAMSLYSGLRYSKKIGGIIALSGYLLLKDSYPKELAEAAKSTPIYAYSGEADQVVPFALAKAGYSLLNSVGIKDNLQFDTEKSLGHSLSPTEIEKVRAFWNKVFKAPESSK
jgi:predicted esterase